MSATDTVRAVLIAISVASLVSAASVLLVNCSILQPPSGPSAADITAYGEEQLSCVEEADARPAAQACRRAARYAFCARFPSMPNCTDGGAP